MSNKLGFWPVFAMVTGSQIGSGVFMLPASLAPYGAMSLWGWVLSGIGAIALALVFGYLCAKFPKTGGPHVYVEQAFGRTAAFFTGWTYWVISWVSTTAVIVASVGYLSPLMGPHSANVDLLLEILLLILFTAINCKGVKTAGSAEFFLTVIKVVPLFIMPIIALFFFDHSNFVTDTSVENLPTSKILSNVTLLTLWGFIGLETATTPAGSVENPSKTIPRALVWGTICVAVLYFMNSLGIMGVISGATLMHSGAPYVDASKVIFGGNWHLLISIIASLICIGTLNAWILASGQISLGLAQDKLVPEFFAHKNKDDAPVWGLLISAAGILPLLILTSSDNLAAQISLIIDFSVIAFLFVYTICCLALLKLLVVQKNFGIKTWFYGAIALSFCAWIISQTDLGTLTIAGLFTASGLPIYWLEKRRF